MTTPFTTLRRVEDLEARLARAEQQLRNQAGREPRQQGKRWLAPAITVLDADDTPTYPDGASNARTFKIKFLDRNFTPTAGVTTYSDTKRSATFQAIAQAWPAHWVPPGTYGMAVFAPPPPGTTGKGKWLFLHSRNDLRVKPYLADIAQGATGVCSVYWLSGGAWADSTYKITCRALGIGVPASKYAGASWEEKDESPYGEWLVGPWECAS